MCAKTYSATVSTNAGGSSLSKFDFNAGAKQFKILSDVYNQIGTYTVTLKGEITSAPTNFATTTFTVTVLDPCLSTTIYPIPTISDMTTSVLLASGAITQ